VDGADVPVFNYDTSSPEVLLMEYRSHRMKRGDDKCVLRISVKKLKV